MLSEGYMTTEQLAKDLATERHQGQFDKSGEPYINHPKRVADGVKTPEEKMVAWLHDILEDTNTTADELLELGFSLDVVKAVQALTKEPGETRISAAHRTAANRIAVAVKLSDLTDNMNLDRLPKITEKDLARQEEYKKVKLILEDAKINRWNNFN